VDVVYLDFAKAFDTVPHRRLLAKLESYGVRGSLKAWIGQFLEGRRQRVGVEGSYSGWLQVLSGVPQGSVLGPLLFVCYINDMPELISSFIQMYADDTKVFRQVAGDKDREMLQADLDRLDGWTQKWQLRFNVDKCKVMHMGKKNEKARYQMQRSGTGNRADLVETQEEKDLGIWMSNTLKPSNHVIRAVNKANQLLGLVRRSFTYMDGELMKQLYTSIVRPHIEYGNVVWHPYLRKDIEMIEAVQHRATRMIPGMSKLPYEERLRLLNLPSMVYRRQRGDAIEVFKYLNGMYKVNGLLPLYESHSMQTRGHCLRLKKVESKSQMRSNFFSFRVVNVWNSLPDYVVTSPTVNSFKGRFDRHCEQWKFVV
jgi:ribonucleases P/MRP protein subunit RPP40